MTGPTRSALRAVASALFPIAIAVAWSFAQAPTYRSECTIQYGREPGLAGANKLGPVDAAWLGTQDIRLRTRSLAESVVRNVRLDRDRSFMSMHDHADATAAVLEGLTVEREKGSIVATIAFEDRDARRAARIANALAEAYIQNDVRDRTSWLGQADSVVADQIELTRQRLARLDVELAGHVSEGQFPALPFKLNQQVLATQIEHLSSEETAARVRRIEIASRITKLRGVIEGEHPCQWRAAELDLDEGIQKLRAEALPLEVRRSLLTATPGEEVNQEVQLIDRRLGTLHQAMRSIIDAIVQSEEAELAAQDRVLKELAVRLDDSSKQARHLQQQSFMSGDLSREHADAEQVLRALRERSLTISTAVVPGRQAQIIERATTPTRGRRTPMRRNIAICAALGLLLALADYAVSRNKLDREVAGR